MVRRVVLAESGSRDLPLTAAEPERTLQSHIAHHRYQSILQVSI